MRNLIFYVAAGLCLVLLVFLAALTVANALWAAPFGGGSLGSALGLVVISMFFGE